MEKSIEQLVAEWFRGRLSRIKASSGYGMTINQGSIFVDGDPPGEGDPPVPYAAYVDDEIRWQGVEKQSRNQTALCTYEPGVIVTVQAIPTDYKKVARQVASDVARACASSLDGEDEPLPPGVVSISPASAARSRQPGEPGNYMQVAVVFTVTLISDLRARPVPSN